MDTYTMTFAVLSAGLFRLPIFLVQIGGIVLAVVYWQRQPKVSLLIVIALIVSLLTTLSSTLTGMLPLMLSEQGWRPGQIGSLLTVMGIGSSLMGAVSLGLLLFAAFGWRKAGPSEGDN